MYIGTLVLAVIVILIPNLPLNFVAILTQVVGGVLMVHHLVFLLILASNKKLMGDYASKGPGRAWGWLSVGVLAAMILLLVWQAVSGG